MTETLSKSQAELWDLPNINSQNDLGQPDKTNAFNHPRGRAKSVQVQNEPEIKPLTAEEIEAIRTQAYQEGLLSGNEEGYTQGKQEGLEKGYQEGFEKGKEQGLEKGLEEAQTLLDEKLTVLHSIMDKLNEPIAKIDHEVKNELVILSTTLAKAIVHIETQQNKDVLLQSISNGIKSLPINEISYQISLHPDDLALIMSQFDKEEIDNRSWQLIESPELSRGGCSIQTENNAVDLSIETRCKQVINQLYLDHGLLDDPRSV